MFFQCMLLNPKLKLGADLCFSLSAPGGWLSILERRTVCVTRTPSGRRDARPLLLNPRSPGDMAGQHTFHLKAGDGAVMRIGRGGEVSHLSSKLSSTGARRARLSLLGLRQTVPVLHAHRTRCCCPAPRRVGPLLRAGGERVADPRLGRRSPCRQAVGGAV